MRSSTMRPSFALIRTTVGPLSPTSRTSVTRDTSIWTVGGALTRALPASRARAYAIVAPLGSLVVVGAAPDASDPLIGSERTSRTVSIATVVVAATPMVAATRATIISETQEAVSRQGDLGRRLTPSCLLIAVGRIDARCSIGL